MSANSSLQNWSIPLDRRLEPVEEVPIPLQPVVYSALPVDVIVSTPSPELPRAMEQSAGFIRFHPKFRQWLHKCGVNSPQEAINLLGEIVCGHPARHVVRVELTSGISSRVVFLKREHVVSWRTRWRNRRAGFGSVSKSEREAITLQELEQSGLPGPQWLAYGEDGTGRAFLLVDELKGSFDLRELLTDFEMPAADRRRLVRSAGRAVAELHLAGFATPDLGAKHVFVNPDSLVVSLLDWQSAPKRGQVKTREGVRSLGQFHATLASELATPQDRLRFLAMYRKTLRAAGQRVPRAVAFVKSVLAEANRVQNRSSVSAQRKPVNREQSQRLVWLQGDTVVAIPELATLWPTPVADAPFYVADSTDTPVSGARERYTFIDGTRAVVVRFRTTDRWGRLWAKLRERPWCSPGQKAARMLFHLQKHGIPGPRLLGFGQKLLDANTADSFIAAELPPNVATLASVEMTAERLQCVGHYLRQLHEARCRVNTAAGQHDPLFIINADTGEMLVGSPFALYLDRKLSASAKRADLRWLVDSLGATAEAQAHIESGYQNC